MNSTLSNLTNHLHKLEDQRLDNINVRIKNDVSDYNENVLITEIDKVSSLIESFNTVSISYPFEYYSELLQIYEFINVYLDFLGLRATFPNGVTLEYLESAVINRHNPNLYQLMYIFLATIFKYHSFESENYTYSKDCRRYDLGKIIKYETDYIYQCEIYELPCDEITISEILRLYLLISSVPLLGNASDYVDEIYDDYSAKQILAQEFIEKHAAIIQSLHHDTIYRLSSGDLLKIFICLLHQILTFDAVRTKINAVSNSPSNYLGCDRSDRKYWKFDSIPGVYIECSDVWKYIDTIEHMDLLIETMQEVSLKQNLSTNRNKIAAEIIKSKNKRRRNMINNYQFQNFNSPDNWPRLLEQKLSNLQYLIKQFGLDCDKPKVDFQTFQKHFFNWIIPPNFANSDERGIYFISKKFRIIERNLCKFKNIPEVKFPDDHLNGIQEHSSKIAYILYSLNKERCTWKKDQGNIGMFIRKFEAFLRAESVAELFLSFYKLYEDLFLGDLKCHICHTGRLKQSITCDTCERLMHVKCLKNVPIKLQLSRLNKCTNCHICQVNCA